MNCIQSSLFFFLQPHHCGVSVQSLTIIHDIQSHRIQNKSKISTEKKKNIASRQASRVVLTYYTKVSHQFWEADTKEGNVIHSAQFHWLADTLCLM